MMYYYLFRLIWKQLRQQSWARKLFELNFIFKWIYKY